MTDSESPLERVLRFGDRHALWLWTVVAALVRLPLLWQSDLTIDETWTWYLTDQVLKTGDFLRSLGLGVDAPLYVAINSWVAHAFGLSATVLRWPPALFGVAAVPLTCLLFTRLLGRRQASAVTALGALSPYLIDYSMEARPYAQLLCCCLLFSYAFVASVSAPLWQRRLLLCGTTILAVGSHYYALVYLAAFYAVVLWQHVARGDRAPLRSDFISGVWSLLAVAPMLLMLVLRVGALVPYWRNGNNTLPGVLSEQLWFAGLSLGPGSIQVALLNILIVALWAVPVGVALVRKRGLGPSEPLSATLGWLPVSLVVATGVLLGTDLMFFPRGFIPSAPFLHALWVRCCALLTWRSTLKRLYVAIVLGPFLLSAFLVAARHPAQAYLKDRQVLAEIVREADSHAAEYDLLLVHHWFMAQYFAYRSAHADRVVALGRDPVDPPSADPLTGALRDIAKLPPHARVMVVLNDLATETADRHGRVIDALLVRRPFEREVRCHPSPPPGSSLLCNRMLIFGAERGSLPDANRP